MTVVSIMQPYFIPYIGYFQLIHASDVFVIHDDAQYIKGGWVNRNRILMNGNDLMVTLSVTKAPHNLPINARTYAVDHKTLGHVSRSLHEAYRKAPQFQRVRPLIEELLAFEDLNVARFNEHSIRRICEFIGIRTRIVTSSEIVKDVRLAGERRVVDICRRLGATDYINLIGGTALYHDAAFRESGISLRFVAARNERYPQYEGTWVPFLSIIDVLMFNSVNDVRRLLTSYDLVAPP